MSGAIMIAVFVACGAVLAAAELLARHARVPVPRAGEVTDRTMRRRSARIGIGVAWWWIGRHSLGGW